MKIQIGHYEFDISEPFIPGHPLSPVEAKVLNGVRAVRIRNILYKKLTQRDSGRERLMTPEELEAFQALVSLTDNEFKFVAHETSRVKRGTLQGEIWELAAERLHQASPEIDLESEEAAGLIQILCEDRELVEEATQRFVARQEVMKNSLEELLSDPE